MAGEVFCQGNGVLRLPLVVAAVLSVVVRVTAPVSVAGAVIVAVTETVGSGRSAANDLEV